MSENKTSTMFAMKTEVYNGLNELLVSCSLDQVDAIFTYLSEKCADNKVPLDRKQSILTSETPANKLLNFLLQKDIPIVKLYDCFLTLELTEPAEFLKKKYPDLHLSSEVAAVQQANENSADEKMSQNNSASLDHGIKEEDYFGICELVLPIVYEEKRSGSAAATESLPSGNFNSSVFGKFSIVEVPDRRLKLKKRTFRNKYEYINELVMIKYRHLNLLTAECIYKRGQENAYGLLYGHPIGLNVNYCLLNEFAIVYNRHTNGDPSQFQVDIQLNILKDISSGLSYLHEQTEQKTAQILHLNLQPDNVLIEFVNTQMSVKLFNFVDSIHRNEAIEDEQLKEEYYNFGLLIFLVTKWQPIDKLTCDNIHGNEPYDKHTYILTLFNDFKLKTEPHKRIRHSMFSMFFYLTSPKLCLKGPIIKYYEKFKKWAQEVEDAKNNQPNQSIKER